MGVIDDIKTNLGKAYTKLETKGATIPAHKNMENLEDTINSVTTAKEEQTKTVGLSMANGDQIVTPDTNKVLSQVTITKPASLLAENIKNGVDIGGVTGNYAGLVPTGNINITDTNQTDVTNYATAQVVDANLVASNIKNGVSVLGVTGSFEGGASLNVEYNSTTAPSDTSKLWVKTSEPTKTLLNSNYETQVPNEINQVGSLSARASDMACGVVGTKCYLFGGSPSTGSYSDIIQVFDTETNVMTTLSTILQTSAHGIACGVVGTKCYLFGGYTSGSSNNKLRTIQVFDTETNTITTLSATLPTGAYGIACGVVGTKCYLFGGSSSSYLNTIRVFDTETNTITTLSATLPTGANGIACGVVGTKCYLFGGQTGSNSYLSTIQVFDTETNQITTLSVTLPTNAYGIACGVVGTKCYLFGGSSSSSFNTIQVFDTETNTITTLSVTLPTNAYGIACGVVGTKCYLFGGNGGTRLITINKFTVNISVLLNNLLLIYDIYSKFKIIDSNSLEFKINPIDCYKGNSNNIGEQVKIALYNETEQNWVEIN